MHALHNLSKGGMLLSISFLASIMLHIVVAVTLGYKAIFLAPLPLIVCALVLFLSKSCIDGQFRRQGCGSKLASCLLMSIFPITSTLSSQGKTEERQDNPQNAFTASVKSTGSELGFVYFLHSMNALIGITSFTILMEVDESFVDTMAKVESASGISFGLLIYVVCPLCLLISLLVTLLRHCSFDVWGLIDPSMKSNLTLECPFRPKSKVVHKEIVLEETSRPNNPVSQFSEILQHISANK